MAGLCYKSLIYGKQYIKGWIFHPASMEYLYADEKVDLDLMQRRNECKINESWMYIFGE